MSSQLVLYTKKKTIDFISNQDLIESHYASCSLYFQCNTCISSIQFKCVSLNETRTCVSIKATHFNHQSFRLRERESFEFEPKNGTLDGQITILIKTTDANWKTRFYIL